MKIIWKINRFLKLYLNVKKCLNIVKINLMI